MLVRILGSAAGGRFPQWNCACANCEDVRRGDPALAPRTQDAIAVSADGDDWFLFNASPDLLEQLIATPALWPRAPRHTPIAGILLGNGDLDHVLGLFSLRESTPLTLYATDAVRQGLEQNVIFRTLQRFPEQVTWRKLTLDAAQPLTVRGAPSGLEVRVFATPGKRPVHVEKLGADSPAPSREDNVGFEITETKTGKRCLYVSAAASLEGLGPRLAGADCLLFDGTFWTSTELIDLGLGKARAEDMAHLPISGATGSLAQLAQLDVPRKIYTHINNTNPILRSGAPERIEVERAGLEIAADGLEIRL